MAIFNATDVVELALELEKSGEAFYRRVAKKAESPAVKDLFEDLAQQEVYHYKSFKELAKTTWDQPLLSPESWQQYMMYLQATVQSAFFEGEDKALAAAEDVTSEDEAIRMAMGFEKETLLFFHDLRDMVSAGDKATLKRIIDEEKQHLRRLADML
jgi:rubrerythrin